MTPARLLLAVALALGSAGCFDQGASAPASPIAPDTASILAPPQGAQEEPPGVKERELPRWEGEYSVALQTSGLCGDGASTCLSYASSARHPVFEVALNESDPLVRDAREFAFTADWTPTTAAANVMQFELWSEEAGRVHLGEGASPFEARIPKETLGNGREWVVRVAPDHGGLSYEQTVRVVLRLE